MSGGTVLEADRTRLEEVEAEILALERMLDGLRTERSSIKGRLDAYKYPVLTLPTEIVSEIFLQFLPAYPDCPSMTGLFSPTILTHICRKWREIALGTPVLWRAISLPIVAEHEDRVHIIDSWLERSRSLPVSVEIDHVLPKSRMDVIQIIQTLLAHRLRWEYLLLYIHRDHIHMLDGPAPLLREIDLWLDKSPSSPISAQAPLLRTAALNDHAAATIVLPWAQLTSLTLHDVYPKECTPILLQTYSLVHCELNLYPGPDHPLQPDVNLPCLKSLILIDRFMDNVQATEYLGTFIVPFLRKVAVPELYIGTDPIPQLTSFIAKSGCQLQEVHIPGIRSVSKELYRKTLPLVSNLSFDDDDNEDVDRE
ncbi:hypothetical protein C8R43DRAFT_1005895 [Mycena crocata]|nr:hypothetical protein C8R43DRAFT_1005895 [Mycena crocata]